MCILMILDFIFEVFYIYILKMVGFNLILNIGDK